MESAIIITSVILVFALLLILRFGCVVITVCGESMEPTLVTGDRLFVFKLLPRLWLRRGQIITGELDQSTATAVLETLIGAEELNRLEAIATDFDIPLEDTIPLETEEPAGINCSRFVKRLIGLPGDVVRIPLQTLSEPMQALLKPNCEEQDELIWNVPKGHCFIRGDGSVSIDSLILGPIPIAQLTGVSLFKFQH